MAYGTVNYKEPFDLFEIRVGHNICVYTALMTNIRPSRDLNPCCTSEIRVITGPNETSGSIITPGSTVVLVVCERLPFNGAYLALIKLRTIHDTTFIQC